MATLTELADLFATDERPAGNLLDAAALVAQAVAATRMYAGYAQLRSHAGLVPQPDISGDTDVSISEWAVIRPLFLLYVERETAIQLEASRSMGVEAFGRGSGEVASEIAQFEAELPKRAFFRPVLTV